MNSVVQPREYAPQMATEITPIQMLQMAFEKGADLQQMQQLMDLKDRWEANEARKAFVAAMAQFKKNPPSIIKDKHVEFTTQKGITAYDHATLGAVCEAVIKGLADVDISHDWDPDTTDPKRISVTCILTHAKGHSKQVKLHAPPDDSGGKNGIQAMGSTITYLERYTLFAITGLAPIDDDDDGKNSSGTDKKTVSEEQIANIKALMTEVNANRDAFMRWARITSLDQILACNYPFVIKALEEKRKQP